MSEIFLQEVLSNPDLLKKIGSGDKSNPGELEFPSAVSIGYQTAIKQRLSNDGCVYLIEAIRKTRSELMNIPLMGKKLLDAFEEHIVSPLGIEIGTTIKDAPSDPLEFRQMIKEARTNLPIDKAKLYSAWSTVDPDKRTLAQRTYESLCRLAIAAGDEVTEAGNLPRSVDQKLRVAAAAIAENSKK